VIFHAAYTRALFFLIALFFDVSCFSQNKKIDSLINVLKTARADTNKAKTLHELAWEVGMKYPDSSVAITNEALLLSRNLNWKKGIAFGELRLGVFFMRLTDFKTAAFHLDSAIKLCDNFTLTKSNEGPLYYKRLKLKILGNAANIHVRQGDFNGALGLFSKLLTLANELNDKEVYLKSLGNIGNIHKEMANYSEALSYYFKVLKIAEDDKDDYAQSASLTNIAMVYASLKQYPKAIEYYLRAQKFVEKLGNQQDLVKVYMGLGNAYYQLVDTARTREYFAKAMTLVDEGGLKGEAGTLYNNIGNYYDGIKNYKKALELYQKAVKVHQAVGNNRGLCVSLCNIGKVHIQNKNFFEAEKPLMESLALAKKLSADEQQLIQHQSLSVLYENTGRPALALDHFKAYIDLRDSIFSKDNAKRQMRTEMDHDYEKKKAVADAEHKLQLQNQKAITTEREKKHRIIVSSVVAGLMLVIVFLGFVFRSLKITRRQKNIIELKNIETEQQKKEIEEKQREILDSIRYAKRIQMAQIPSDKHVSKMLGKINPENG
jgi:tetratricopeptide (TPR) repeat protein